MQYLYINIIYAKTTSFIDPNYIVESWVVLHCMYVVQVHGRFLLKTGVSAS